MFAPAPYPINEAQREASVLASGLMNADVTLRLHDYVQRARQEVGTAMAALTIIYQDRQLLIAAAGLPVGRTTRASSFCGHAILRPSEILCVPDTHEDERFAENPLVLDKPCIRFYAGAPLRTSDGHALGTLCVFDPAPRAPLNPMESEALRSLAQRVMQFSRR